jgi:hypothetical protein
MALCCVNGETCHTRIAPFSHGEMALTLGECRVESRPAGWLEDGRPYWIAVWTRSRAEKSVAPAFEYLHTEHWLPVIVVTRR